MPVLYDQLPVLYNEADISYDGDNLDTDSWGWHSSPGGTVGLPDSVSGYYGSAKFIDYGYYTEPTFTGFHSSFTVPLPAGIEDGDTLIFVYSTSNSGTGAPSVNEVDGVQWTSVIGTGTFSTAIVMAKRTAASEGSSWNFTLSNVAAEIMGAILVYRNMTFAHDFTDFTSTTSTKNGTGTISSTMHLCVWLDIGAHSTDIFTVDPATTSRFGSGIYSDGGGSGITVSFSDESLATTTVPARTVSGPAGSYKTLTATFGKTTTPDDSWEAI